VHGCGGCEEDAKSREIVPGGLNPRTSEEQRRKKIDKIYIDMYIYLLCFNDRKVKNRKAQSQLIKIRHPEMDQLPRRASEDITAPVVKWESSELGGDNKKLIGRSRTRSKHERMPTRDALLSLI
jgi:hypothetical protein